MSVRAEWVVAIAFAAGVIGCGGSGGGKPDGGGRSNDGAAGATAVSMPDAADAGDGGDVVNGAGDGAGGDGATEVAVDAANDDGPLSSDGASSDALTSDTAPDAGAGPDATFDASVDAEGGVSGPCEAVSDGTYYVDPLKGSNVSGTGSAACPFLGLARATKAILDVTVDAGPSSVPAGTKILLRGDTSVVDFTLPPNVTLSSDVAASPRTITVPTDANGFLLVAPGSALANLVIDGQSKGLVGIRVSAGTVAGQAFLPNSTTTTLTNVKVTNMRNDGILVSSGGLGIRAGVIVVLNGNNSTGAGHSGLHISGGTVTIAVGAGEARTGFDRNNGNGIEVEGASQLLLTGKPDLTGFPANPDPPAVASGAGTITANENLLANVAIAQKAATVSPCIIDGLVSWKAHSSGLALAAGSNVTVRNSVVTHNVWGVNIGRSFASLAFPTSLNLGDDVPGRNIFQVAGGNANAGSGLCVADFGNANLTILAKGNFWSGKDCTVATVPVTTVNVRPTDCQLTSDVGVERSGGGQQTNVRVDLSACQSL